MCIRDSQWPDSLQNAARSIERNEPLLGPEKSAITRWSTEIGDPRVRYRESQRVRNNFSDIFREKEIPPSTIIRPEDYLGRSIVNVPGDRLNIGVLTEAGGVPLSEEVIAHGGPKFAREHSGSGIGWSSMKGAASSKQSNFRKAMEKDLEGRPPIAVYRAMAPSGINFAIPTVESLIRQIPNLKIAKSSIKQFNEEVRNFKRPSDDIKKHADFVGIDHPQIIDVIRDQTKGDLRKAIIAIMEKADYRDLGFPIVADVQRALTDTDIIDTPTGYSGHVVFESDPTAELLNAKDAGVEIASYDTLIPGKYAGTFGNIAPEMMYPQTWAKLMGKSTKEKLRSLDFAHHTDLSLIHI